MSAIRIGVFTDVHGNAWALEAVLKAMQGAHLDLILFLGDALVRVPAPRESMALLRSLPHQGVRGNYDQLVLDAAAGRLDGSKLPTGLYEEILWTQQQLDAKDLDYLAALPVSVRLFAGEAKSIVACHANPRRLEGGLFPANSHYKQMSDAASLDLLADETARTVVCGHTHAVLDRQVADYRILNPGSVSLGWNEEDEMDAWARWAILEWDGSSWRFFVQRVCYDHQRVWRAYQEWDLWSQVGSCSKVRWWAQQACLFAQDPLPCR